MAETTSGETAMNAEHEKVVLIGENYVKELREAVSRLDLKSERLKTNLRWALKHVRRPDHLDIAVFEQLFTNACELLK